MINVIGETVRLSQSMGVNRLNPSWSAIDLMGSNIDGDTQNPLYSADVEGGLRFAPEAKAERRPQAKNSSDVWMTHNWMIPRHEHAWENKVNSNNIIRGFYTYLMRNLNLSVVNRERHVTRSYITTETSTEKFGGYYQWQTRSIIDHNSNSRTLNQERVYVEGGTRQVTRSRVNYYQTKETYKEVVRTYSAPQEEGIAGNYAIIAQTFYLSSPRVLFATQYYEDDPGGKGADRKYFLCRCYNGVPSLSDVIAKGSPHFDQGVGRKHVFIQWDKPILVNAGEQLAIVIMFNKDIDLVVAPQDENRTGQLMTSKDYFGWEKLIFGAQNNNTIINATGVGAIGFNQSYDLAFDLLFARFAGELEIPMPNFELTGGISTAKVDIVAQMPKDGSCSINTMVKINDQWEPLSILNQNVNLPPSTEVKLVLRGTQDVMPLIDIERSTYTLFRPKNNLTYVTKERTRPANNVVKLALEVAGYDARYHTIDCVLLVGEQNTEVRPTVALSGSSSNGSTGTRRYEFQLPVGTDKYRIKVSGATVNASVGFDISSIVEFH